MAEFANLLGEAIYVSQYSQPTVGYVVHVGGVPANPDGDVTVTMEDLADPPNTIFTRVADNPSIGVFEVTLNTGETDTPGTYKLSWEYAVSAVAQEYISLIEVGEAAAVYDNLPEGMKGVVEAVWLRFADLFDSPFGGPHLQVYYQTRFGRGRIANLLYTALGRLNTIAQPHMTYAVEGAPNGKDFPLNKWGAVLEQGLYIEVLKHLIRSYVEQPDTPGVNIAKLDRRDYLTRWQGILSLEQSDFEDQLDHFKIAHMGLGRPRVMVSGGVYGTYGPTRLTHSAAARPRYYVRFH